MPLVRGGLSCAGFARKLRHDELTFLLVVLEFVTSDPLVRSSSSSLSDAL